MALPPVRTLGSVGHVADHNLIVAETATKAREFHFNVKDYGAVGNGSTDDTTAIQSAITACGAAGGGEVFVPSGTYKLTLVLNISVNGVTLRGANRETSSIQMGTANAKIINNTAQDTQIRDLRLSYSVTPSPGAVAIYSAGTNTQIDNVRIVNGYTGVEFTTGSGQVMSNVHIYDCVSIGIYVHNVNDIYISKFLLITSNPANFALGAIRMIEWAEAIIFTDGDAIGGVYPITVDATTYSAGTRPAYNAFTNVYFDSAAQSALLNKTVETVFTGCWFSNGRSGGGATGVTLTNCEAIVFQGCRFYNCGYHGARLDSTATRISLIGCMFVDNSQTAGIGSGDGLNVGGATEFSVIGCIANGARQGYGINISGASDKYRVNSNQLTGNVTGGLVDTGTGINKSLRDNVGFNPRGSLTAPSIPATTVAQNNTFGTDATVYVVGGTVTVISVGGTSTGVTSGAVNVPAGSTITLTYSVAPTWKWFGA